MKFGTPGTVTKSKEAFFEVLKVFPNPANGTLNINYNKAIGRVVIRNSAGVVIYTEETDSKSLRLDTQNFPAGVYTVLVISQNNTYTRKISVY